jgi:signal transduction histidine kinase
LPLIEADLVQIQQVLLNLVVNAFEAMRETPAAERRVIIRSERESEGRVRVSVRDFGAGLPTQELWRIFVGGGRFESVLGGGPEDRAVNGAAVASSQGTIYNPARLGISSPIATNYYFA